MSLAALHPHIWRWILQCVAVGFALGVPVGWALGEPLEPLPPNERGPELVAALAAAQPRVPIDLKEGTYTGPFVISRPGTVLRRPAGVNAVLTLRDPRFAQPGADWTEFGGGVYRFPAVLGNSIYRSDGRRVLYARDRAHFDAQVAAGVPVALRGVGETLLFLDGEDPRGEALWISKGDGTILGCAAPDVQLEGLDLRYGGGEAIQLRAGCHRPKLHRLAVSYARIGLRAVDPQLQDVEVSDSTFVQGPVDPDACYRDEKGIALVEGAGIALPGIRPRILRNTIREFFDGIGLFCPGGCSTVDPLVEGNEIDRARDDALELDGAVVRGLVQGNRARGALVGISMSPRVAPTGEDTVIRGNVFEATRVYRCFDRSGATTGEANVTKFNNSQATDLLFEGNAFHGLGHVIRGAVGSSGPYPKRVRWIGNLVHSRFGPLVRFPGLAADGNVLEGNAYVLEAASGAAISAWNQAPGPPVNYATLSAARASSAGQAAGWEGQGAQFSTLESAMAGGEFPSLEPRRPAAPVGARIEP